jgi:hypothetical protein
MYSFMVIAISADQEPSWKIFVFALLNKSKMEVKIPSDERATSTAVPNSVVIRLKIPPPRPAEQPSSLGLRSRWHLQGGLAISGFAWNLRSATL